VPEEQEGVRMDGGGCVGGCGLGLDWDRDVAAPGLCFFVGDWESDGVYDLPSECCADRLWRSPCRLFE
jgi:hypothetical protein